jgi:competence protein ComEA
VPIDQKIEIEAPMMSFRTMLIVTATTIATLAATAVVAEELDLPEAPGKAVVMEACTQCHGIDMIVAQPRSPDEWTQVVSRMVGSGASLTDEQYATVVAYLSKNLGNSPDGAAPAQSAGH